MCILYPLWNADKGMERANTHTFSLRHYHYRFNQKKHQIRKTTTMKNLFSLFLSQSYQDCWDDYCRSMKSAVFPQWDYIVLTASDEQQAEGFRRHLEARAGFLPPKTKFAVIPDRGGKRVGSGGATLSVIKYLHEQEGGFQNLRVLVIHSGGDSKRVPQYSALGKLFSPVPHAARWKNLHAV